MRSFSPLLRRPAAGNEEVHHGSYVHLSFMFTSFVEQQSNSVRTAAVGEKRNETYRAYIAIRSAISRSGEPSAQNETVIREQHEPRQRERFKSARLLKKLVSHKRLNTKRCKILLCKTKVRLRLPFPLSEQPLYPPQDPEEIHP